MINYPNGLGLGLRSCSEVGNGLELGQVLDNGFCTFCFLVLPAHCRPANNDWASEASRHFVLLVRLPQPTPEQRPRTSPYTDHMIYGVPVSADHLCWHATPSAERFLNPAANKGPVAMRGPCGKPSPNPPVAKRRPGHYQPCVCFVGILAPIYLSHDPLVAASCAGTTCV